TSRSSRGAKYVAAEFSVQQQSGDRARGDNVGLSHLEPQQEAKPNGSYDAGRNVDDRLTRQDDGRPGDGAGGGRGRPCYEGLDLGVVSVADETPAGHDDAQLDQSRQR